MSEFISINGRKIGVDHSPYVIAEMSANHNGDISNAYKIIDMAKASGQMRLNYKLITQIRSL